MNSLVAAFQPLLRLADGPTFDSKQMTWIPIGLVALDAEITATELSVLQSSTTRISRGRHVWFRTEVIARVMVRSEL